VVAHRVAGAGASAGRRLSRQALALAPMAFRGSLTAACCRPQTSNLILKDFDLKMGSHSVADPQVGYCMTAFLLILDDIAYQIFLFTGLKIAS